MPQDDRYSDEQIEAIRAALRDLLAWEPLRRSPNLAAFLTYIVEARIRGDAASIKAYAIAVDVFGRPETFDPQTDPIVRVQARRLRSLLGDYYAQNGTKHAVRITLPRGHYVPKFVFDGDGSDKRKVGDRAQADDDKSARAKRVRRGRLQSVVILVGLAGVFLGASLVFWPNIARRDMVVSQGDQPRAPLVVVEEFENLTDDAAGLPLVAGLALELVTDFNLFPHIIARYGQTQADVTADELASGRPVFVLSGVARRTDDGVQYGGLLTRMDSPAQPVSVDVNAPVGERGLSLDDVSRLIVLQLASPRGALHAPARAWLEREGDRDRVFAPYPCMVAFSLYEEAFDPDWAARVQACALAEADSDVWAGAANAMLATLAADEAAQQGIDLPDAQVLLDHARNRAALAVDLAPTNGFAWRQYGHVASVAGEYGQARDRYHTAMQLNPADAVLMAQFALVNAQSGDWALATEYSDLAMTAQSTPPPRFHVVPALWALRTGEYMAALPHARAMAQAYPRLAAAALVAIGGHMGVSAIVDAHLSRLLADPHFRRLGIIPALQRRLGDRDVVNALIAGISRAGVPLDRLANPF